MKHQNKTKQMEEMPQRSFQRQHHYFDWSHIIGKKMGQTGFGRELGLNVTIGNSYIAAVILISLTTDS